MIAFTHSIVDPEVGGAYRVTPLVGLPLQRDPALEEAVGAIGDTERSPTSCSTITSVVPDAAITGTASYRPFTTIGASPGRDLVHQEEARVRRSALFRWRPSVALPRKGHPLTASRAWSTAGRARRPAQGSTIPDVFQTRRSSGCLARLGSGRSFVPPEPSRYRRARVHTPADRRCSGRRTAPPPTSWATHRRSFGVAWISCSCYADDRHDPGLPHAAEIPDSAWRSP